jgi:hypothetical protein
MKNDPLNHTNGHEQETDNDKWKLILSLPPGFCAGPPVSGLVLSVPIRVKLWLILFGAR